MKNLKLIDGKFNVSEAKEILVNIFSSQIQFHINKNFISEFRTGKSESNSVQRIDELKKAKKTILALIEEAEKNNLTIELNSSVKISTTSKNQLEKI